MVLSAVKSSPAVAVPVVVVETSTLKLSPSVPPPGMFSRNVMLGVVTDSLVGPLSAVKNSTEAVSSLRIVQ